MNILIYQIISTLLALLGVFLAARQNILKWPIGIFANIIAIIIYRNSQLNIKSIIAFVFIIDSFYGWRKWLYGGPNKNKLHVTKSSSKTLFLLISICLILVLLFGKAEIYFTNDKISYIEAFAIFSVLAHWMMARKKLETWFIWIALDVIYIFICIYKSLYIFAIKYFIYTILAIFGYLSWKKSIKKLDNLNLI